ncbi:MAG: hypothetical protein K8T91_06895 [Planctomycetes bacterium]|nr:hypothetical protein [Planctomycetota bacterium]
MNASEDKLLPASFLFRFAVPCFHRDPLWTAKLGAMDEKFRLPRLTSLDDEPEWADVRVAWSIDGLAFSVLVQGKKQPLWCRANRVEDSDGFVVWIDTRDTHNVHRASRFCHELHLLPAGGGPKNDQPVAFQVAIDRARELPKPIDPTKLKVRSQISKDGYLLEAFIPGEVLSGFEPAEHPRLGFQFAVCDRELNEQTFTAGREMPYRNDPSLWGTLELVK